ncbi:MAG: PAS domain S-box protein, partial [Geminicoccales bacterium]
MRTFHYALRPGGYLFLGQSESITRNAKLFAAVDKKHRIFQRRDVSTPAFPDFPLAAAAPMPAPASPPATRIAPRVQDRIEHGIRRVMEGHSPAYVVIDKSHEILRFSGGEIGRYLEPSPGTASLNLFGIVRKALRSAVRAAVQRAYAAEEPVVMESLAVKIGGKARSVKLIVEPLAEGGDAGLCVVAFQDVGAVAAGKAAAEAPHPDLQAMEQELHTAKAQLQAAIDELETANEEMKSANEEYQSVNEELQSSNEELETAKEEMQSVNEELQTINAELSSKNDLLTRLNSDLKNLLESTQIATIFLDGKLRIKSFTPGMTDLFHLRDSDRGRPITEIVTRMEYADLRRDVAKVMRTLAVVEREVRLADEEGTFLMRVRPYRTVDNVIDGTVITFVDISERKRREEAMARLAEIVDSSDDAVVSKDLKGIIKTWNRGAERLFGYKSEEVIGQPITILIPPDRHGEEVALLAAIGRSERVDQFESVRRRKDGRLIDVSLSLSPIRNAKNAVVGVSKIARDITARKRFEEARGRLAAIVDSSQDAIIGHAFDGTITSWNAGAENIFGFAADDAIGKSIAILLPDDQSDQVPQ